MNHNNIIVVSKRRIRTLRLLQKQGFEVIDVTSKSNDPLMQQFSPFYPHHDIPIPGRPENFAESVEGIWQGLKVFQNENIDITKFLIKNMKNMKRPCNQKRGKMLYHSFNMNGEEVQLRYIDARYHIYLPAYKWVLEHRLSESVDILMTKARSGKIALLDYDDNGDINNPKKPLSHAHLIRLWLLNEYP